MTEEDVHDELFRDIKEEVDRYVGYSLINLNEDQSLIMAGRRVAVIIDMKLSSWNDVTHGKTHRGSLTEFLEWFRERMRNSR